MNGRNDKTLSFLQIKRNPLFKYKTQPNPLCCNQVALSFSISNLIDVTIKGPNSFRWLPGR